MGMTGIEIYKLLPQTNCGDCGVPTCLAFAMKLAAGQAELAKCPHVSEASKAKLDSASAPPVMTAAIGPFKTGGETVLFRHEKTFVSPTGIAVLVSDAMDDADVDRRLKSYNELRYERVGVQLAADLVAVKSEKGDAASFEKLAQKVAGAVDAGLILMSENADILAAALKHVAAKKPLLYAATKANADAVGKLGLDNKCPVAVKGENIDEVIDLTQKLSAMGLKEIVIDSGARTLKKAFEDQVKEINAKLGREALFIIPTSQANTELRERIIRGEFPGLTKQSQLFLDQIGHPTVPLVTLNAYLHFATIYGQSPVGLPMPSKLKAANNPEWDEDFNRALQELAWKIVTNYPLSGVKAN